LNLDSAVYYPFQLNSTLVLAGLTCEKKCSNII